MRVVWSSAAWVDIERLYAFLADRDLEAADVVFDRLANAPSSLLDFPRRGSPLSQLEQREVREFRVGNYLLRYELRERDIIVLRFFHVREDRL